MKYPFRYPDRIHSPEPLVAKYGARYDILINSKLNESKCQIYCSPSYRWDDLMQVLPQAERTLRPWSLGFVLPATGPTPQKETENGKKLDGRYEKAITTAKKATTTTTMTIRRC